MKRLLFSLMPDTVVTRAVTVLVVALLVVAASGYLTYRMGIDAIVGAARERELAERISSVTQVISATSSARDRDRVAHTLSTPTLEVHWALVAPPVDDAVLNELDRSIADRLGTLLKLDQQALVVGYARSTGPYNAHDLQVSVRLPDMSWLWFLSHTPSNLPRLPRIPFFVALFMCAAIILIAVLSLRWVTRPLRLFARAAEKFNIDAKAEKIPETGPIELRAAARAMNVMLERIQTLVRERTAAFAALSHDLRTLTTRIQLRNELIEDMAVKEATEADLAEMDGMIQSTLEYLRSGGVRTEARRSVDIVSVLHTICDEQSDLGHDVALSAPSELLIHVSPIMIKRAFRNIIENACKYAGKARVEVTAQERIVIAVRDEGPGIPDGDAERVFEPFYRVETSRSRETGGTGLGLPIARHIIHAHGGSVTLANRLSGGLEVLVTLPRTTGAMK